jgi:Ran GTPase-activating protein (RanGAP) involved in mRNA processing and transport
MHSQTMKVLELENNMLRHDGEMALADSLQMNTSLTNIYLGVNIIGRRGSFAIANALKVNISLMELNLLWNPIGDDGAIALAGALKFNPTLSKMSISPEYYGHNGAAALQAILKFKTDSWGYLHVILFKLIGDEGTKILSREYKMKFPILTSITD